MPSYEPTPRRFSIISVSRTASRRNSIDEPSRPVFDRAPPTPSSPVDLTRALQKLQHVRDGSEVEERGRSRQSAGERAIRTTWGHDEPIKVPAARRESSASTRDRIAIWEQRSRSQSMGRSKSRGRGLETGSRISVVPEVPELLAALAKLQTKERSPLAVGTNFDISTYEKGEGQTPALGGNANEHDQVIPESESETFETPFEAHHSPELRSNMSGSDHGEENEPLPTLPNPWRTDDDHLEETTRTGPDSFQGQSPMDYGVLETLHAVSVRLEGLVMAGAAAFNDTPSASTIMSPVLVVPESLPTPAHTPPPVWCTSTLSIVERAGSAGPASPMTPAESISTPTKALDASKQPVPPHGSDPTPSSSPTSAPPALPSTPVMTASKPAMLLTPEATPDTNKTARTPIEMTFERVLTPTPTLCEFEDALTSTPHQSPLVEPTYRPIDIQAAKDTDWDEGTADHFHLPPSRLAEVATTQEPSQPEIPDPPRSHGWPSQQNASPPSAEPQILTPEDDATGYHNVWRIKEYEPEFRVGQNSAAESAAEIRRLTDVDFSGNPLQDPPRSQLSAEAEPFRPIARDVPNPYPYSNKPGGGDFDVHIPPSPTSTYRPRLPPRNRPSRRDPPGRYTARRGTTNSQALQKNEWDAPPMIERAIHAASIGVIQGLAIPTELVRGLRDTYNPPPGRPDIVKAYQPRRRLPVRIFFPTHHDLLSPAVLPCLFTIHGGGFTLGTPSDDDAWNRSFADTASVLVIALNYSKAPWSAFPHPLLDVEALYHAVLSDASLPLDPSRTALCGFDAGANLALALSQLPSVRAGYLPRTRQRHPQNPFPTPYHLPTHPFPPPRAVIPICGLLDFATAPALKAPSRPYKPTLAAPRGWGPSLDLAARLLPSSAWSYIPYGHNVADPLLSPAFAARHALPPHVMVVGAELDCLAHESWRAACAWAGRATPDRETPVGRRGVARARGCLDDGRGPGGGKFAWGEEHEGGGTTRWLLVPDVMHGFESAGWRTRMMWADEEGRRDAEMKTYACQREMADWLWGVVWK